MPLWFTAGPALGYGIARVTGLNATDARTVAIEVGMQNGGMATGRAFGVLQSPAAALGAAVFGPWSAITASALASWWRGRSLNDACVGETAADVRTPDLPANQADKLLDAARGTDERR